MSLINFGIDFGNGYVKAKSNKAELIFPSVISPKDLEDNAISKEFMDQYDLHLFKRKEDENSFFCGTDILDVVEANKLRSTNSSNNRYDTKEFQRLVVFSLAELASYEDTDHVEVRLVTGMPSDEFDMKVKKDTLKEFILGMHVVERDGSPIVVNVKEVHIIEQPLGTLFNQFLNDSLQVHKDFKYGNVVVIDFGSGTTIIDQYHQMKRSNGTTIESGTKEFFKGIAKELTKKHSVKVNQMYVEKGIKDKSLTAVFGQSKIPFKAEFERKANEKIENTISHYEDDINETLVNNYLITGGGANILSGHIQRYKDNFHVVDNAQTATANGYYKLALVFASNAK